MTSLGFNRDTIIKLMSMIDDSKYDVSESEYIKMCNAMKYLHSNTPIIDSYMTPPLTTLPLTPTPTPTPTPTTLPLTPPSQSTERYNRILCDRLQDQINIQLTRIERLKSELETFRHLRTVNKHYQEVIEELLPDTKVRGPRGGMVQMTSQEIKGHIEMLLRRNLLTSKNDIKYKAESKKQREKENIMQNIKYHINQKEQLVLEYRNIMQDHSY